MARMAVLNFCSKHSRHCHFTDLNVDFNLNLDYLILKRLHDDISLIVNTDCANKILPPVLHDDYFLHEVLYDM